MDTTYHILARLMVKDFDYEVNNVNHYNYGQVDWFANIRDMIEIITEDYACDRYDETGYSLISTPSIIKKIDYHKLVKYMEEVEYDICIIKLFDYDDEMDLFDENDDLIISKKDELWNAYT
jgi:hypothetical protein